MVHFIARVAPRSTWAHYRHLIARRRVVWHVPASTILGAPQQDLVSSSSQSPATGVTELLLECRAEGNRQALDRVFPLVYDELRRIAHRQLQHERDGHTLV